MYVPQKGLGDKHAQFRVYIGNQPNYPFVNAKQGVAALVKGEIYSVCQECGNGWRKVFNVYAKLLYALSPATFVSVSNTSWQHFRDHQLLQASSNTGLFFSPLTWEQTAKDSDKNIHIVMGKTYANSLKLPSSLSWLNHEFAIDVSRRLIVCPYFDYRQLSNQKIIFMVNVLRDEFGIT